MQPDPENSQYGDPQGNQPPRPPELGKGQKIAVAVLAVFALFVVVIWTVQFKKSLTQPFVYNGETDTADNAATSACSGPDCPETVARQKSADTDHDSLNDYDELYIYQTSPYLEDSDSDGILDGVEVKNGTDPNCPEGKVCYKSSISSGAQTQASSTPNSVNLETLQQMSQQLDALSPAVQNEASQQTNSNTGSDALQQLTSGQIDAKTLRQLLIDHGMQKSVLDKISDDELIKSFGEVMSQ
ncbi:MAG: thrombospondin type 3 repeat-containing protein [Patescibacteria group bacterium]|jgi:hypothetical protein